MTEDWESFLGNNPKVLWGLVADVVKAVKASEGERKTGRRPAASCDSIEELYEILFPPAYSGSAFAGALADLLKRKGMSQRQLAALVFVDQATVSRWMAGRTPLTVEAIELIARALDVRPTYFAEYRAMKLGQIVTDVLMGEPALSANSVRRMVLAGAPA